MHRFLHWLPVCLLSIGLISACSTARRTERFYAKTLKKEIEKSPVFAQSFTGFTLLDPETGRTLCDVNGGHHFTPASNLKILTLATCLGVLGDSVPAFRYIKDENGLTILPTGDPTFLHPAFKAWQSGFKFLQTDADSTLDIDEGAFFEEPLGVGWAWDDANYSYSAEKSPFPIYGNVKRVYSLDSYQLDIEPKIWKKIGYLGEAPMTMRFPDAFTQDRDNEIYYWREIFPPGFERVFSVREVERFLPDLLVDTLHKEVNSYHVPPGSRMEGNPSIYSTPLDTVLRRMMYQSDNFIAEQMLLVCAGVKYDLLAQDRIIKWAKDSLFATPITPPSPEKGFGGRGNPPRWVDGSGLSRYNLVSPRYLTAVLWKLWREQPHDRLLGLFPTAGAPETTLDWWQPVPAAPWLFAKTGSMGGVVCISGYLRTRRGKTLIFSFMNNNFVGSARPWRLEMRRILELVAGR